MVTVKWADGKNPGMEQVDLFNNVRHCYTRIETSVECLGDKCDLSVGAKVFMAFPKAVENGSSGGEGSNKFVISM